MNNAIDFSIGVKNFASPVSGKTVQLTALKSEEDNLVESFIHTYFA